MRMRANTIDVIEAYAIYFHRNIAVAECASADEKDKILEQYYSKARAMMWAGIGCSFVWLIWLIAAVIIKLSPTKENVTTSSIRGTR